MRFILFIYYIVVCHRLYKDDGMISNHTGFFFFNLFVCLFLRHNYQDVVVLLLYSHLISLIITKLLISCVPILAILRPFRFSCNFVEDLNTSESYQQNHTTVFHPKTRQTTFQICFQWSQFLVYIIWNKLIATSLLHMRLNFLLPYITFN